MGYITADNVRLRVWKVTSNQVSNDIMNEAIMMAAADIDSACGALYSVPFAETYPDIILAINNALVRYYGQFLTGHLYDNMSETDKAAYGWAQVKLKALKEGSEIIPGVSKKGKRVRCNTSDYHPTFDRGDPTLWVEDPDRLDDISDAKD